jgi:DNA repair protein RadC
MRVAEITVKYDIKVKNADRPQIKSSQAAAQILQPFYDEFIDYKEVSYVILLNRANRLLGVHKLSEGGMSGTVIDLKILFQAALLAGASAVILSHNHPSGTLKPSTQDETLTKKVIESGKMLEIDVLDHVILTSDGYFSFADEGKL